MTKPGVNEWVIVDSHLAPDEIYSYIENMKFFDWCDTVVMFEGLAQQSSAASHNEPH